MAYNKEVAKIILGDNDFNGLDVFFEKTLAASHAFKVAMARRCFNLCHVLKGSSCIEGRREVITDNALLFYADDFAEHFISHGRFPSVLLFDDILLYGRAVYNALYRMEEAVFDALERRRVDVTRRSVHEGLFASVDIRVYALGNIDDVIDSLYLYKVSYVEHRYGSDMLQLSRNVSEFLNYCGGANTSFLLSTRVEGGLPALEECTWMKASWNCGDSQGLVLIDGHGKDMRMVHGFVQGASRNGHAWVTGLACVESTAKETLSDICGEIAQWIKTNETLGEHTGRFVQLLRSDNDRYIGYRMSFVALLASGESLWRFLSSKKGNWDDLLYRSDIARICRHFGKGTDLLGVLEALLRNTDRLCEWTQMLYGKSVCIGTREVFGGDASESLFMRGEGKMCEVGMRAERDAYDFGHRRKTFAPLSADSAVIPLTEFLDGMEDAGGISAGAFACEMAMQHRGVNSMGYDTDGNGMKDGRINCYLKAGELATHTFPQRHRYVLPALAYIEMATRTFPKPPEQILNSFVQGLPEDNLDGVPMPSVIEDLKMRFLQYAGTSFYIKKGVSRWAEVNWGSCAYSVGDSTASDYRKLEGALLALARAYVSRQAASL